MATQVNINPNEESSRSQCAMIIDWLQRGFSLTQMQAVEKFGCGRLQARINELRNKGYNIKANMVRNELTGKKYADYTLIK